MSKALLNIRHEGEINCYCENATCAKCAAIREFTELWAILEGIWHRQTCAYEVDGFGCPGGFAIHYWPPISVGGLA